MMGECNKGFLLLLLIATVSSEKYVFKIRKDFVLDLNPTDSGIELTAHSDGELTLSGILGIGKNFSNVQCSGSKTCTIRDFNLTVSTEQRGFRFSWVTDNVTEIFQDCFELSPEVNWFGGPERSTQVWPLEKMDISGPYVIRKSDNFGVAERYWLNSKGTYIFVEDTVPLFVEQEKENKVCFVAKVDGPYVQRKSNHLDYFIGMEANARDAHLYAVKNKLGVPNSHPDDRMIGEPIWTTWAKYKREINDETVLAFADTIRKQGYKNGQLEIDDKWETCYGSQEFNKKSFGNIKNTVAKLHADNFRVSLWVHPFVEVGCDTEKEGLEKGYFVKATNGSSNAIWWNSDTSHQIDFTNAAAASWFYARLTKIRVTNNIDSFKFDAGETDYTAEPALYPNANIEEVPNALTSHYVRSNAAFGRLIEVRSAWRTQKLPIFLRMLDKDSIWGLNNGLASLITTLLQLNMNGYSFILPDMVGGNGYQEQPDAELIVRWTQANTFMPAMQFSYLPWEFTAPDYNPGQIVKKFVELHGNYSQYIIDAMKKTIETGSPTNPPIWWIDPTDSKALACDDEYLLGENILVAPVIVKGARSRSVYLPKGQWKDGNNGTIYTGPITLNYNAPIDTLPFFIKQ